MICTIDVGNTQVKIILLDEKLNIVEEKTWSTPDLFEPERWEVLFNTLNELNPLFFIAELRISCVSWRAFLALRVYLKYDSIENFNPHLPFNPDYFILPQVTNVVIESNIPIHRNYFTGMIGSDRLLSAYASHKMFDTACVVVSLGTATTIDLVTTTGVFLSGAVIPGIDASYQGLTSRATSLPNISEVKSSAGIISSNIQEALYNGTFISHAILIEEYAKRLMKEANINGNINIILTGGRASSIAQHLKLPHKLIRNLVNYGIAMIPNWKTENKKITYSKKTLTSLAKKLSTEDLLKIKNIGV